MLLPAAPCAASQKSSPLSPDLASGGVHPSVPLSFAGSFAHQCCERYHGIILKLLHRQPMALLIPKCCRDIGSRVKKGRGIKLNKINEVGKRKRLWSNVCFKQVNGIFCILMKLQNVPHLWDQRGIQSVSRCCSSSPLAGWASSPLLSEALSHQQE